MATGLWLPGNLIAWLNEQKRLAEREARAAAYTPPQSQLDRDSALLLWVIEKGDAERARQLAKELATKVYDDHLSRNFCEHTGYPYFHECEDYW